MTTATAYADEVMLSKYDWIGLDWIGLDWIGLDWIGLDWIKLNTEVKAIIFFNFSLFWRKAKARNVSNYFFQFGSQLLFLYFLFAFNTERTTPHFYICFISSRFWTRLFSHALFVLIFILTTGMLNNIFILYLGNSYLLYFLQLLNMC